jgi:hypothetical protein
MFLVYYNISFFSQKNRDVQRSRKIQEIVRGFLPKNMIPKEQSSEIDLLLQFCSSLEKVKIRRQNCNIKIAKLQMNEIRTNHTVSDLSKAQRFVQLAGR